MAALKEPDIIFAQEHHIADDEVLVEKLAQVRRKGWQAAARPAQRTKGGTSGGTAVLCNMYAEDVARVA